MKTADGKHIHCDGRECQQTAYLPVGLRAALNPVRATVRSGVTGWLFVARDGANLHFCPICGKRYLRALNERQEV